MNTFFSRDILKRQSRTRTRKIASKHHHELHIIPEEDEPRSSCVSSSSSSSSYSASSSGHSSPVLEIYSPPSSPSLGLSVKAKRRRANIKLSDIKVARREAQFYPDANDESLLLFASSPPRPAPRPPASLPSTPPSPSASFDTAKSLAIPSPDSFRLTFTDTSFTFPHPPIPTPSSADIYSDSESSSEPSSLPTTPSTSDDDLSPAPCPKRTSSSSTLPRRASIKPLFVVKHNPNSNLDADEFEFSHDHELIQPFKNTHEQQQQETPDPDSPVDEEEDTLDWYARQFNQILTLASPLPPSFAHGDVRRESSISSFAVPSYPPPPPPVPSRPPPRTSLPTDFDYYDEDESRSEGSVYSQQDIASVDDVVDMYGAITFDLDDVPMRLPLSLPDSPIDLDAGLEELRMGTLGVLKIKDSEKEREERERLERGKQIPDTTIKHGQRDEVKVLRSRWSSSTLSSLKEERERDSAASKLRLFLGGAKAEARNSKSVPTTSKRFSPMSPTKKQSSVSPRSPAYSSRFPSTPSSEYSDVMVIGREQTLRRSGSRSSTSTNSGSMLSFTISESSLESTGSGLRRKPIPVEMFLRSA